MLAEMPDWPCTRDAHEIYSEQELSGEASFSLAYVLSAILLLHLMPLWNTKF